VAAAEVAVLLECSDELVYSAVRKGELPNVGLGRSVRIPRAYIDQLLSLRIETAPEAPE
jgi:excisionase family DNA binding protein